jgi:molecular chaperone HscB
MQEKSPGEPAGGQTTVCWSCRSLLSARALFCHGCGSIQAPRAVDHFSRLGVRARFDLDLGELERQYFGFQRRFHPDRFATRSPEERALSLRHATALNEAYEVLRSPARRANYLLHLANRPTVDGERLTTSDPALLTEAMELRETLTESVDGTAVDRLIDDIRSRTANCMVVLTSAFGAGLLDQAATLTLRLTYLDKVLAEARQRRHMLTGRA